MTLKVRSNSTLQHDLGRVGVEFLEYGTAALTRILPHVETSSWKVERKQQTSHQAPGGSKAAVTFTSPKKTRLRLVLTLSLLPPRGRGVYTIQANLERRRIAAGVGSIRRTISDREKDIAERVLASIAATLGPADPTSGTSLAALRAGFDERVVARHLTSHHELELDLGEWFATLRRLAEQTYENKSMAFGCVIDPKAKAAPDEGSTFPQDFLQYKKYRALSDGYRTAYRVSRSGALLSFIHLRPSAPKGTHYFPEWCDGIAAAAHGKKLGIALTRQGDIVVIDEGHLTFTYRFGRWQYWNHTHVVDLITNAARVQNVPPELVSGVVRSIYRAALDVAFRHSGGLFVLLRNK